MFTPSLFYPRWSSCRSPLKTIYRVLRAVYDQTYVGVILIHFNYYQYLLSLSYYDYCWANPFGSEIKASWNYVILVLKLLNSRDISATAPIFGILDWICYHRNFDIKFAFSTRLFYREGGVCIRPVVYDAVGLYDGTPFENLILNNGWSVGLT